MRRAGILGGVIACIGCAPDTGVVLLQFQTEASFVVSEVGRLRVIELEPEQTCGELIDALESATSLPVAPVWDSGDVPVCGFRSGGVLIPDVPQGPLAYLFSAARGARTMAYGCRIAEVREGPAAITLTVTASDDFLALYGDPGASDFPCRSIAARCDMGCTP